MTKISNNHDVIENIIDTEWYFLTKRPDVPPLPVWYKIKYSALHKENKKIYGGDISWACFWYGNTIELYLHGNEYKTAIRNATEILYAREKFHEHLLQLQQACRDAKESAAVFNNDTWRNHNNKKLFDLYSTVVDKYVLSFVYGFITWCTPVLQKDAQSIVVDHAKELQKIRLTPDQALSILIIPDDLTAYQEKEKALMKLSKMYQRITRVYRSEQYIFDKHPALDKEIKKFLNQYRWVGFNYVGPALDYKAVVKELIQTHDHTKNETPSKEEIYSTCTFNRKERHLLHALEMMSYAKDLRNATDDYIHYCFDIFYDEISQRTGLTKSDIQFLWSDELQKLLTGTAHISRRYIREKRKCCAAFASPKKLKIQEYYTGDEAAKQREIVLKNSNRESADISQNIIKGTIASTGIATGTVKIINNVREVGKVKKGDILVTCMTSPKYMPAIYNAGAIITDDGGLTCHAAIIARELKKPCIIGTKVATNILKDGDVVDIDAHKGLIKVVKKKIKTEV